MQDIRVLFYTDSYINHDPDSELKTWGLSELEKLITYKTRGLATFQFDLINRHLDKQRIERKLLCKYDELWVFGVRTNKGEPFELNDDEVQALKNWMDQGGGLFVTGDHSVPFDSNLCEGDHKEFPNLGLSLGNRIKRAGEMREWKGPPTACAGSLDNFNTQEFGNTNDLDDPGLDKDNVAQTLFEMPDPPHRLFWWRVDNDGKVIPIQKFPDHGHEGKLLLPDVSGKDWPARASKVVVAARGLDKRFGDKSRVYYLVLAFDGDTSGVGRIVADSSFHHYFNINLRNLPSRSSNGCACGYPELGSDLDQIAQYYGNLALWLTPLSARREIKFELLHRVAEHPEIFEVQGSDVTYMGRMARQVIALEVGGVSNLYLLLASSEFEASPRPFDEVLTLLLLGKSTFAELSVPEHEIILGSILRAYQAVVLPSKPLESDIRERRPLLIPAITEGLKRSVELSPGLRERVTPVFDVLR